MKPAVDAANGKGQLMSPSSRAVLIAMVALCALPPAIAAQEATPQVVFNPAPGVTQTFRVKYRLRYIPDDGLSVDYKLAVTPAREKTATACASS